MDTLYACIAVQLRERELTFTEMHRYFTEADATNMSRLLTTVSEFVIDGPKLTLHASVDFPEQTRRDHRPSSALRSFGTSWR